MNLSQVLGNNENKEEGFIYTLKYGKSIIFIIGETIYSDLNTI